MDTKDWLLLTLLAWNLMDTVRFVRLEDKIDRLSKGLR